MTVDGSITGATAASGIEPNCPLLLIGAGAVSVNLPGRELCAKRLKEKSKPVIIDKFFI
jgi:hypothetical protein